MNLAEPRAKFDARYELQNSNEANGYLHSTSKYRAALCTTHYMQTVGYIRAVPFFKASIWWHLRALNNNKSLGGGLPFPPVKLCARPLGSLSR